MNNDYDNYNFDTTSYDQDPYGTESDEQTTSRRKRKKDKKNKDRKKHGGALKTIFTLLLAFVLGIGGGLGGAYYMLKNTGSTVVTTTDGAASTTSSSSSDSDATTVAEKMSASVVAITTESMTTDSFWYGSQVTSGAGSGVIMSEDGYIITCAHVVSGASNIQVTTVDNKKYTAKLVGSYTDGDIAVIKIDATGLTAATFADTDSLVQGQTTYAVGNPEGTFSNSITSGIISALNRTITVSVDDDSSSSGNSSNPWASQQSSTKTITLTVIQTDAAVSPGNSGGGLFDADGNCIGIVNAKSSSDDSEGLGFAIYGNTALKIAESLVSTGSYSE